MLSHQWDYYNVWQVILTFKVNLLHNVLGFDALFLVEDEYHTIFILCPAIFTHPHFHLSVCREEKDKGGGGGHDKN